MGFQANQNSWWVQQRIMGWYVFGQNSKEPHFPSGALGGGLMDFGIIIGIP